ncbi:MAG: DUF1501 domain-containing protein [Planctomycetota bacterium]
MKGASRDSDRPVGHQLSRRAFVRAGAIGLGGLSCAQLAAWNAAAFPEAVTSKAGPAGAKSGSVIYVFLSGGLAQHDSFDMKPEGKKEIRGPFSSIPTQTPGLGICEHLPMLAKRSSKWALCRSLSHPFNEHSQGHMVMLSGRTELPPGFNLNKPRAVDWPSIAAITGSVVTSTGALHSSMVLPERLIHRTGRVIPGQFSGLLGAGRDPWFVDASAFNNRSYGAYPSYNFHHQRGAEARANQRFSVPKLEIRDDTGVPRFRRRVRLLDQVRAQQRALAEQSSVQSFDRYHGLAVDLLVDGKTRDAFDIDGADPKLLERYGKNSFGRSLLLAKRLVEAGVRLVQVNLGNNETWDTHVNAFHNLEKFLFPPTDRALAALFDDLSESGLLEDTLVVVAGEFGRTPRIFSIGKGNPPGRDHWGAVQTVLLGGGGVQGGAILGSSDARGEYPKDDVQRAENLAANIYEALGVPRDAHWEEGGSGRPHPVYGAEPIPLY